MELPTCYPHKYTHIHMLYTYVKTFKASERMVHVATFMVYLATTFQRCMMGLNIGEGYRVGVISVFMY